MLPNSLKDRLASFKETLQLVKENLRNAWIDIRYCTLGDGHEWEYVGTGRIYGPMFECERCHSKVWPVAYTDDEWGEPEGWNDPYAVKEDAKQELNVEKVDVSLF